MVVSVIHELKVVSEYKRSRDRLPSRESSTCCGGRAQFFFSIVLNQVFPSMIPIHFPKMCQKVACILRPMIPFFTRM